MNEQNIYSILFYLFTLLIFCEEYRPPNLATFIPPCYFLFLPSKYSPQYAVFKYTISCVTSDSHSGVLNKSMPPVYQSTQDNFLSDLSIHPHFHRYERPTSEFVILRNIVFSYLLCNVRLKSSNIQLTSYWSSARFKSIAANIIFMALVVDAKV